jgi:hypothetical protein
MYAIPFPEANTLYGPPEGYTPSQVAPIPAHSTQVLQGSCEGAPLIVVAWQPTVEERKAITDGASIFVTCLGFLPPHMLTTSFEAAMRPH